MNLVIQVLIFLLTVLQVLIFVHIILSWLPMFGIHIPSYHPAVQFIYRVTEPILAPLRRYGQVGMVDLSPIIAFFVIALLKNILRGQSISRLIALAITLVIAFTIHEFMHALVAYRLGDPTAKNQGRLSLDPRRHLDVLGSLMVLAFGFGWAKPVPVNPNYLRHGPKTGMAVVAAAGPLSNLVLAVIVALLINGLGIELSAFSISRFIPSFGELLLTFIWLNVVLFFFNLIPIAPLDGFKVVLGFLPYPTAVSFRKLEPVGPLILLLLFLFAGGFLSSLIVTPTNFVVGLLIR
jgi:Zn-dependent protease